MRRCAICVVLFWWFALNMSAAWPATGRVVGPFATLAECEKIRAEFGRLATPCWTDSTLHGPR